MGVDPALARLLEPLRAAPLRAGLAADFDGTLSPIVDDPAAARPVPGAADALAALASRYAVVAVVSGRPLAFLADVLPGPLRLSGSYGLESAHGGVAEVHPDVAPWVPVVAAAAEEAERDAPAGTRVERKGLSLTLHYRGRPDLEGALRAWAAAAAERHGLDARDAKMSVELHPPLHVDKGSTVRSLASGLDAFCFLGDDLGDLPAFSALAELRAHGGLRSVGIAVRSAEAPAAVLDAADAVVDGPAGALEVLRHLL